MYSCRLLYNNIIIATFSMTSVANHVVPELNVVRRSAHLLLTVIDYHCCDLLS